MDSVAVQQQTNAKTLSRRDWDRDGVAAVRDAIPMSLIQQFDQELKELWKAESDCKILTEGVGITTLKEAAKLDLCHHHYRIMDVQNYLPSAYAIAHHDSIRQGFLSLFGVAPAFCQSLTFEYQANSPCIRIGVL